MSRDSNPGPVRKRRRPLAIVATALVAVVGAGAAIAAFAANGPTAPDFRLTALPRTQTVYLGRANSYGVTVSRLGGFNKAVRLSASHLPPGTTASWRLSDGTESAVLPPRLNRARLVIRTSWNTPTNLSGSGTPLTITGTSRRANGTTITHSLNVTLAVRRLFVVTGSPQNELYPGASRLLNLSLTNPHDFDVKVTKVGAYPIRTDRAGCGTGNFAVAQIPSIAYPFVLPAGRTRTLSGLGVPVAQLPQVRMIDSSVNQDACKGAHVSLFYLGTGER